MIAFGELGWRFLNTKQHLFHFSSLWSRVINVVSDKNGGADNFELNGEYERKLVIWFVLRVEQKGKHQRE